MNPDGSDGKYDNECEELLYKQKAEMVVLLVVDGKKGHGMSVCINARNEHAQDMAKGVPELLRKMADAIDTSGEFKESGPKMMMKKHKDKSWTDIAGEKDGDG